MATHTPSEETKIVLKKSDVTISPDGHLTIKDKRLADRLKATKIADSKALQAENIDVSVSVTVHF